MAKTFFIILEKWGAVAALAFILAVLTIYFYRKQLGCTEKVTTCSKETKTILKRLDEFHDNFHGPVGELNKLKDEIKQLREEDLKMKGEINVIGADFHGIKDSIVKIEGDIKTILHHVLGKV